MCAGHGAELGGESPLRAELRRFVSLGKGFHREVGSGKLMAKQGCDGQKPNIGNNGLGNLAFDRYPELNERHVNVDSAWPCEGSTSYPGRSYMLPLRARGLVTGIDGM